MWRDGTVYDATRLGRTSRLGLPTAQSPEVVDTALKGATEKARQRQAQRVRARAFSSELPASLTKPADDTRSKPAAKKPADDTRSKPAAKATSTAPRSRAKQV